MSEPVGPRGPSRTLSSGAPTFPGDTRTGAVEVLWLTPGECGTSTLRPV